MVVIAGKTHWSLTELRALPRSELFHYLKLITKADD